MSRGKVYITLLLFVSLFIGCGGSGTTNSQTTQQTESVNTQQTEYISSVPAEYFRTPANRGQVIQETYRSKDYTTSSDEAITKAAYVYIPYGYNSSERYNIFYLMHGWTMTAGDFFSDSDLVKMLDNLIARGMIEPLIVVCATFDAENKSQSFTRSTQELLAFHNDLRENLIPYIEGKYSTYNSREHRAFGGFSLGAVTTWHQFIYCLDLVKYFLPMSGDCWIMGTYGGRYYPEETARYLENVVHSGNWSSRDFYIWEGIGTSDPVAQHAAGIFTQTDNQIQAMMKTQKFTPENLHYGILQDGRHDPIACETMYHALRVFFGKQSGGTSTVNTVTESTKISEVINNPAFGDYGRFLFPLNTNYYRGDTLGNLSMTWYSNINPARTVDIVNYMLGEVSKGRQIFYQIYPAGDERAESTGLFFFRGNAGAKFAVCNAGGGFVFVGAMHDSFPHALELSRKGYNAFALIYRPGADTACEDLARAIAFIHENAEALGVDTRGYSLCGGSAGARMAAWLGTYGTEYFSERKYPRPSAVIMQYTGLSEVTGQEPPTYACVGTNDGIASYSVMQRRIAAIRANGTDAEIDIFRGLSHGFGLGEGTVAEGWLNNAVTFWEKHQ